MQRQTHCFRTVCLLACWGTFSNWAFAEESKSSPAAIAPTVNFAPDSEYDDAVRMFQGISGLERSPGGRLWATWYGGGVTEDRHNYILLVSSDDEGKTWSENKVVIDPDKEGPVRAFDPCPWVDPSGKLWLFWCQATRGGGGDPFTFAMTTENPDDAQPKWSTPQLIHSGVMMCKPTALANGDWLLPTAIWSRDHSCRVVASTDQGKTWSLRGTANVPEAKDRNCDEPMIVQRKNGELWQLVRTSYGIGESSSTDGGKTWTPVTPWNIQHTASRFFIRRLHSGNLLLVKHGPLHEKTGRSHLTAYLSKDDGQSWEGGLLLDERSGVSYPDGAESKDGVVYLTYDYDRRGQKYIYMTTFTEADVLAKKPVSDDVRMRVVINQATGLNVKKAAKAKPVKIEFASNDDGAPLSTASAAEIRPQVGEVQPLKLGAQLFTDRNYTLHELPKTLAGKRFVQSSIDKGSVKCTAAGVVLVVTPTEGRNGDSLSTDLLKQGFTKVKLPEFLLFSETNAPGNVCTTYQKNLKEGETLELGKWGVILF
ncbi:glycoside hydrolase [Blastopirellula sp. J2-11]|uniref:sialidase family protein n=1 Tax=Blastopirellula sp. J2-11 TaxID=2943192 RepID=UPI0021CA0FC9|nr:sialidase family protein [Blastopirellula sp. J2-11]UUO04332.1 glycoside hydrolase [Blastopirellula sp. J2-11]